MTGAGWEFKMFESAYIINEGSKLNTFCMARAAQNMAAVLEGLTEVGYLLPTNEVASTAFYLDGNLIAERKAGEMWGPELTAIIEAN